ncbi:hypothetical protein MJO29_001348 [Puccinia striiformis f. sp. tritici]|uniref:hypothetical protein n=1 Tax=Puccinia striiformis f. sp. tritici TaxID=168172 RepID=UPI0020074FA3|nr:hypothetical protein Pst134EA_003403 [Puccinia striiformis f. sp. tritici]KAH9472801.1 hypothetical protein Pst134EA_003403 [Puccinia striiformis f. sp. tritici]KAI7965600.1 hypothetical protein MJO29_001348 [Puccinia striiformis f. sp. tritici]
MRFRINENTLNFELETFYNIIEGLRDLRQQHKPTIDDTNSLPIDFDQPALTVDQLNVQRAQLIRIETIFVPLFQQQHNDLVKSLGVSNLEKESKPKFHDTLEIIARLVPTLDELCVFTDAIAHIAYGPRLVYSDLEAFRLQSLLR